MPLQSFMKSWETSFLKYVGHKEMKYIGPMLVFFIWEEKNRNFFCFVLPGMGMAIGNQEFCLDHA